MADSKLPEQRDIKTEGGNYNEYIERNYIQAETVNYYEQNRCGSINTVTQKLTCEKQLTFVLTGTIGEVDKAKLRAIQAHLRKISGDAELTIIDVEEGSIRLRLDGSPEGLKKLEELFKSGELTEVLDIPVEDVYFASNETEDSEENTEDDDKPGLIKNLVEQLPGELPESVYQIGSHYVNSSFSSTIYVGNLSYRVTEADLREVFAKYGRVEKILLPVNRKTGRIRGFAFVEMKTFEEASVAIKALDGAEWMGRSLKVNSTKPQSNLHENYQISSDKHY